MFSRTVPTVLFSFFFMFAFVAASPAPWEGQTTTVTVTATAPATTVTESPSQCNTGPIQCCDTVESASSSSADVLLGLLGIVLSDLNVLVGLTCSPVSVIGVGGGNCNANAVCCENNSFGGLISIGCVPVIL